MIISNRKRLNKKVIIIIVCLLVVAAAAGFWLWRKKSAEKNTNNNDQSLNTDGINYGPPTEEERQETEQRKDDIANQPSKENSQPSTPSAQSSQVSVVITYANSNSQAVEAAGFVNGVLEDGGTCTLTLTKGSAKVTGTSQGFADVSKTTCAPISIPRSQIPQAGEWSVVLSYKSSSKNGSSAEQKVSVP